MHVICFTYLFINVSGNSLWTQQKIGLDFYNRVFYKILKSEESDHRYLVQIF